MMMAPARHAAWFRFTLENDRRKTESALQFDGGVQPSRARSDNQYVSFLHASSNHGWRRA